MISFNPLWHTLIDKGIKKTQLCESAGISRATMAKMAKNEKIALDVVDRICKDLNCKISDIMEYVPD